VRRALRGPWPALAAFLVSHGLLCLASASTARPPWEPGSWEGPDSAHYLSIAKGGYTLAPCDADDPPPGHCGNAGWMPLYPWLMRPLILAGMPPRWAAAVIPFASGLASLTLLSSVFLSSWPGRAGLALAAAAFFPGQVYLHGAFPLSLLTLLTIVCLGAAMSDRWWLAAVSGFAAALTYATGWLLAPVLAAWALLLRLRGQSVRLGGAALATVATMAGLGTVLLVQRSQVGVWNAFFVIQAGYGHRLGNPVTTWWLAVREALSPPWQGVQEGPHLQTFLVALWVLAVLVAARTRLGERRTSLLALFTAVFWLFPLALGSGVSLYRSEAALLPSVLLGENLPRPVLAILVVAMALVAWPMAVLFFRLLLV
jgi:hypothetical protein